MSNRDAELSWSDAQDIAEGLRQLADVLDTGREFTEREGFPACVIAAKRDCPYGTITILPDETEQ